MNFLRKIVSGKRKRLQTEKYDLDITYVTERVCGMSFPASGFEKCYRNNINDVRFFETIPLINISYVLYLLIIHRLGSSLSRRET